MQWLNDYGIRQASLTNQEVVYRVQS